MGNLKGRNNLERVREWEERKSFRAGCRAALMVLEPHARDRGVELCLYVPATHQTPLLGDALRIRQIVTKLVRGVAFSASA